MSGNAWMFSDQIDDEDLDFMTHEFVTCMQTRLLNLSRRDGENMKGFPTQEQVYHLREKYPVGIRLELDHMDDRWAVPKRTKGTVTHVDDAGQIHVKWDNGRGLAVIPGVDSFHTVKGQQTSPQIGGMKL